MAARATELRAWARSYAAKGWVPIAVGRPIDSTAPMELRRKAAKAPALGTMFSEVSLANWEAHWPWG